MAAFIGNLADDQPDEGAVAREPTMNEQLKQLVDEFDAAVEALRQATARNVAANVELDASKEQHKQMNDSFEAAKKTLMDAIAAVTG